MILLGLLGCPPPSDSGTPTLPACASPVAEGWDPVEEEEVRLSEGDVTWSSPDGAPFDPAATEGCAAPPCLAWSGPGRVEARLLLNRGVPYRWTGTFAGDAPATFRVEQIGRDGSAVPVSETEVAPGAVDLEFVLETVGVETVLSVELDAGLSGTLDELRVTGSQWAEVEVGDAAPVRLGFLLHVEESNGFETDAGVWGTRAQVVAALSALLARHGAVLTLQPDVSFARGAALWDPGWVAARSAEGMAWSAHLHDESDGVEAFERAARDARRGFAEQGLDVTDINGGFGGGLWESARAAGFRSSSAFKSPETQLGLARAYTSPWRPAEGTGAADELAFGEDDPDGPLVYVPGMGTREVDTSRFVSFATRILSQVRLHARDGFVNTWYFVDHIDAYGPVGEPEEIQAWIDAGGLEAALAPYEALLTEVTDPLVAEGSLSYDSPAGMAAAFEDWEADCTR